MGFAFPAGKWPSWAYRDMWAPELYFMDGGYRLYFTARRGSDQALCIGVAFSSPDSGPASIHRSGRFRLAMPFEGSYA